MVARTVVALRLGPPHRANDLTPEISGGVAMSLAPGIRLGPYEITAPIAASYAVSHAVQVERLRMWSPAWPASSFYPVREGALKWFVGDADAKRQAEIEGHVHKAAIRHQYRAQRTLLTALARRQEQATRRAKR